MIYFLSNYFIMLCVGFILMNHMDAQLSQDVIEQGRAQYQLLQERRTLPIYGSCWKSAVEHIDEGCLTLSEETQSSIALHLANCFLEMSGHESYNCELEKKPNLKQICISSMSDRAFNVYTEFYTHTQNICWFLRGQIWQETTAENMFKVAKQLEQSAKNLDNILTIQKETLDVQEKLLNHGHELEKIMEKFYISTRTHEETLVVMSSSLKSLQSWLVGEFSWIDLLIFYISASILIVIFTSTTQTSRARFPMWILLIINGGIERLICTYFLNYYEGDDLHNILSKYVWWTRKSFYILALITLIYFAYCHKDLNVIHNILLQKIYNQNLSILNKFEVSKKLESVEVSFSTPVIQGLSTCERSYKNLKKETKNSVQDDTYSIKTHLEKNFRYNLRNKSCSLDECR